MIKIKCKNCGKEIEVPPQRVKVSQNFVGCGFDKNFDEALAMFVNQYWNELSEEERKQIKEILE